MSPNIFEAISPKREGLDISAYIRLYSISRGQIRWIRLWLLQKQDERILWPWRKLLLQRSCCLDTRSEASNLRHLCIGSCINYIPQTLDRHQHNESLRELFAEEKREKELQPAQGLWIPCQTIVDPSQTPALHPQLPSPQIPLTAGNSACLLERPVPSGFSWSSTLGVEQSSKYVILPEERIRHDRVECLFRALYRQNPFADQGKMPQCWYSILMRALRCLVDLMGKNFVLQIRASNFGMSPVIKTNTTVFRPQTWRFLTCLKGFSLIGCGLQVLSVILKSFMLKFIGFR